jgi:DNA polymerase I-like protein with 3'-5' exonuclease and polymerase domains
MGANTLVDTMGERNITLAQSLLNLPKLWTHKQIAEHLLSQFHKTYPSISAIYYKGVVHEILSTRKLSSQARHICNYQASSSGWTRYCFGSPDKNKLHLNAYVAHGPQSLNAMTLNRAFMAVFYEIALQYPNDFRLCAQIHDSILFQVRKGHEHLAEKVRELMEIPVSITAYTGVKYEFTVPAALKGPGTYWSEL